MNTNIDRRIRGTHSTVCKNKNPQYHVPATHTRRHAFIRDLVTASDNKDVTKSDEALLARHQDFNARQKHFYKDRANAINALHKVFCEHVNLATHQIEISLRNASDAAGLSTTSQTELNKAQAVPGYTPQVSISRASRALRDMIQLGWIVAPASMQVWDKEAGCWIDKYFEATTVFFNAAGITTERVRKQQASRLAYYQKEAIAKGMTLEEAGKLSITKLREQRRLRWRQRAFERRSQETARKKLQRRLIGETREQQRHLAAQRVLASLGGDASHLDFAAFKDMVNQEIAMIRKFAGVTAPPH